MLWAGMEYAIRVEGLTELEYRQLEAELGQGIAREGGTPPPHTYKEPTLVVAIIAASVVAITALITRAVAARSRSRTFRFFVESPGGRVELEIDEKEFERDAPPEAVLSKLAAAAHVDVGDVLAAWTQQAKTRVK
jgi:hypothetical protein